MRKGLFVVLAVVAFVGFEANMVLAKGIADNGPGCGLGKELWRDYPGTDAWGVQILISTTNNTIVPFQAFGITSQTMGCHNGGKFWAAEKANVFAAINFENLSQEMAQGGGEHLASMATLMGVPAEHQGEFFGMTQERYTTLVKAGEASPVAGISPKQIGAVMKQEMPLTFVGKPSRSRSFNKLSEIGMVGKFRRARKKR